VPACPALAQIPPRLARQDRQFGRFAYQAQPQSRRSSGRPTRGTIIVDRAIRFSSCAVILCFPSSCAAEQQATKMQSALTPYVGRSIADYVVERGPPTTTIDLGGNRRAFQWQINRTNRSCGSSDFWDACHRSPSPPNLHGFTRCVRDETTTNAVRLDH